MKINTKKLLGAYLVSLPFMIGVIFSPEIRLFLATLAGIIAVIYCIMIGTSMTCDEPDGEGW